MKFHLIGNPPSCGSTLLGELLDSTGISVCGPELEFFCNQRIYDFKEFKNSKNAQSKFFSFQSTGMYFQSEKLQHYGLNKNEFNKILNDSNSINEFVDKLKDKYCQYRGVSGNSFLWFEKTPQNVNAISQFLNAFQDSYFISIIRNPIYVHSSLINRGKGAMSSCVTWMLYLANIIDHIDHPRLIVLKYEDLVKSPYEVVSKLMNRIAPTTLIDPSIIEENYASNEYIRQFNYRPNGWSVQKDASVKNANEREIPKKILKQQKRLLSSSISEDYANLYGFSSRSYKELLQLSGYFDTVTTQLSSLPEERVKIDIKEFKKVFTKSVKGVIRGTYALRDIPALFRPLQF
jgi:hypothetical protein